MGEGGMGGGLAEALTFESAWLAARGAIDSADWSICVSFPRFPLVYYLLLVSFFFLSHDIVFCPSSP